MRTFLLTIDEAQRRMIVNALCAMENNDVAIVHDETGLYDYSPMDVAQLFETLEEDGHNGLTI